MPPCAPPLCLNPDWKDFKDGRNVWVFWVYEPPASRCACRVPLLLTQKGEGGMVDAYALGACGCGHAGSNPAFPTNAYGGQNELELWMVTLPRCGRQQATPSPKFENPSLILKGSIRPEFQIVRFAVEEI